MALPQFTKAELKYLEDISASQAAYAYYHRQAQLQVQPEPITVAEDDV